MSAVRSAASSAAAGPLAQSDLGRHLLAPLALDDEAVEASRPRTGASPPRPTPRPKTTPGCFWTIRARAASVLGDRRLGGDVARADVLGQRAGDQLAESLPASATDARAVFSAISRSAALGGV